MELQIAIPLFGLVLTALGTLLLSYFREMKNDVKNMTGSLIELNIKLERVILDQTWHKEEISVIKERLDALQIRIDKNR